MQESGVLQVKSILHQKEGTTGNNNPENYYIEDRIEYYLSVEQKFKGIWHPYICDDMQLEFVMLEPYIRLNLKSDNKGTFSAQFRTP